MNTELTTRIDELIALEYTPRLNALARDCKAEIINLSHQIDVINESAIGTIQALQAEIQRLLLVNETLKGLCEDYQAQIKELAKVREYVPMTRTEWNELIEQYSANEHNTPWRRFIEAEVIKRANLKVKENDN